MQHFGYQWIIKVIAALCHRRGGVIPAFAAAWYLHQFLHVADRTGINPVPTADVCNTLVINGLSRNCSTLPS